MSPHGMPMQSQGAGGGITPTHSQPRRRRGCVVNTMSRPL